MTRGMCIDEVPALHFLSCPKIVLSVSVIYTNYSGDINMDMRVQSII